MQALLASLAVSLSVRDSAYKSGMAAARAEAKRTGQDFEREGGRIAGAIEGSARAVNRAMVSIADKAAEMSASVTRAGLALTVGLSTPLVLMERRAHSSAASFETSMGRVRAAMLGADAKQIEQLSAAALQLGPAMGRSAIEAADAIEMLAKNGMSAEAILNGGLAAALRLAAVGGSELGGAADLTTDILAQFGKGASDLPAIVDKVSGALDASKMNFDDYRLAIAQAGGVAGGIGFRFEDLNVALAATSSLFASGSDAGTSFKTFLTSLSGNSKEAQAMIAALGLEFFDAQGNAKSLSDIAEQLRTRLSGLNDTAKQDALKTIFGTDAMRTAIGLMNAGAAGIDKVRASIDAVTADDKLKVLLDGDAAASQRLSGASEQLSIKLGQVLLPVWTMLKDAAAATLSTLAAAPPWFMNLVVATGSLAASIGPLILVVTTLAKFALPLLLLRLGPVSLGLAAIINPIGVLIRLLGSLALQAGASTAIGMLGARMVALAGPIGAVISLLLILGPLFFRTATANDTLQKAQENATKAQSAAIDITARLAAATGKLRQELLEKARADARAAVAAVNKAKADVVAARSALERAKAEAQAMGDSARFSGGSPAGPGAAMAIRGAGEREVAQRRADLSAANGNLSTWITTLNGLVAGILSARGDSQAGGALPQSSSPSATSSDDGRTTARDASRDAARFADERSQLQVDELSALADLTGAIDARYRAEVAAIAADRASYERQLAGDEALTKAQRAELLAAKDKVVERRLDVAEQQRNRELARQGFEIASAANEAAQEVVRGEIALADNAKAKRAGEMRLLELQRRHEEAKLDLILATEDTSSAAWSNASAEKDALAETYRRRGAQVQRDTEGPAESYLRSLRLSADAVAESIEATAVSAMSRLNDELADAVLGAGSVTKAFASMATSIVRDLVRIGLQRSLVAPLANRLFGEEGGGGGMLGGLLGRLGFGGGKASGGRVGQGNWYMVGEHGPEAFVPEGNGTVVPAGGLRGRGGTRVIDLRGAVMTEELVESLRAAASGDTDIKLVEIERARQRAGRRRLGR